MIVAVKVLVELFIRKVVVAGQTPFDEGVKYPAINPVKEEPDGLVTPPNVTVLASLLVNTTDPVDAPHVVLTIELAVKVTAGGFVRVYGPPLIEHPFASVTITEYTPAIRPFASAELVPLLQT